MQKKDRTIGLLTNESTANKIEEALEKTISSENSFQNLKVDHEFSPEDFNLPEAMPMKPIVDMKTKGARRTKGLVEGDKFYLGLVWKRIKGKFRVERNTGATSFDYTIGYDLTNEAGESFKGETKMELKVSIDRVPELNKIVYNWIKFSLGLTEKEKLTGTATYNNKLTTFDRKKKMKEQVVLTFK